MIDTLEADSQTMQPEQCGGPTVQEVHIDFLLEEEFSVGTIFLPSFIQASARSFATIATQGAVSKPLPDFIQAALEPGAQFALESVEHSVSDSNGEADLILIYRQLNGAQKRVALLIEDKIRASFQPRQAERYQDRGKLGQQVREGAIGPEWHHYWTCLVAAKSYIKSGHGFDAAVELEQIKEWFASNDAGRTAFKLRMIEEAIHKASMTGVKKVDFTMTAFRTAHYAFFEEFFKDQLQDVSLRLPAPTWKGDSWFEIRSRLLPKGAYINHKSPAGFVDLTFPNTGASRLKAAIEPILETGMKIEKTGKSAAVRLTVSKIENFNCFAEEQANVAEAFSAVTRLLHFYVRERARLQPILEGARTAANTP